MTGFPLRRSSLFTLINSTFSGLGSPQWKSNFGLYAFRFRHVKRSDTLLLLAKQLEMAKFKYTSFLSSEVLVLDSFIFGNIFFKIRRISKCARQFSLYGVALWYISITSLIDVDCPFTLAKVCSILWENNYRLLDLKNLGKCVCVSY